MGTYSRLSPPLEAAYRPCHYQYIITNTTYALAVREPRLPIERRGTSLKRLDTAVGKGRTVLVPGSSTHHRLAARTIDHQRQLITTTRSSRPPPPSPMRRACGLAPCSRSDDEAHGCGAGRGAREPQGEGHVGGSGL